MKRPQPPQACRCLIRRKRPPRHWRLVLALIADRIERRIGRQLTDRETDRLLQRGDPLQLREMWLRYGGCLEVREGRLELSRALKSVEQLRELQRVG